MFWNDNGHLKGTGFGTLYKFHLWKNWGTVKKLNSPTKTMEGGGEHKKWWDCGRLVIVGLVASCKRCRARAAGAKWQKCKRKCCGLVILGLEWSRRRCRRWLWCLLGGIVAAWSLVPRLVQEAASGEEWGKQAGGESTHWRCILNLRMWNWEVFFALIFLISELLETHFDVYQTSYVPICQP